MTEQRLFEVLGDTDVNLGGARLGKLKIDRIGMETPNFLAISSRGVVPHISPDVIAAHTDFPGIHMAIEDFIEKVGNRDPPILNCPANKSPLHAFTAIPGPLITLLVPRRTPAVLSPNGNSNSAVSLFTSTGFQPLTNASYIDYIQRLRPDIAVALGDVPYGNKPGAKRTAKMGDRTQQWVAELLSKKAPEQAVFAPILPLDFQIQAEYIDYLSDEAVSHIEGLVFYNSNLLPEIPATTSFSKLARLSLDEPASPHHILRQISFGMDIFTIPFIGFATDAGIALTFRFPSPLPDEIDSIVEGSSVRSLGIDMWTPSHATSLLPLSKDCTCYTCTSHHRAYIQHLLAAKEMLGWVLIQIHNHHILSSFFAAVRKSIQAGSFGEDCKIFAKEYESELPEKSGQGPRVRGYHFKSEGPGEGKKNKAPWGNLGGAGDDKVVDTALVPDDIAVDLEKKGFAEVVDSPAQ